MPKVDDIFVILDDKMQKVDNISSKVDDIRSGTDIRLAQVGMPSRFLSQKVPKSKK